MAAMTFKMAAICSLAALALVSGAELENLLGGRKCMQDLGCFEVTSDFVDAIHRPANLLPDDREFINTRFFLYTKENPREQTEIWAKDPESVRESYFNPARPTKFIVHGFLDKMLFGEWMEDLKDQMLLREDFNVIVVDWSGGNAFPYIQATANTRVVGAEIAFLVHSLQNGTGLKPEDCHILGHSLGSHVAGYAGERLNRLGRITGMDPADPYFGGMPHTVRLDSRDAIFVDIVHSDAKSLLQLGFGMGEAIGHVDFYPNDGKNQPGCTTSKWISVFTSGLVEGIRRLAACNHQRSIDFVDASINAVTCQFVGTPCTDWKAYEAGLCSACGPEGRECVQLGLKANQYLPWKDDDKSLVLYLKTGPSKPFCIYHYRVNVRLSTTSMKNNPQALFTVKIEGSRKESAKIKLSKYYETMYPGSSYNYLFTDDKDYGELKSLSFMWSRSWSSLLKINELIIQEIEVTPIFEVNPSGGKGKKKFCPVNSKPIKSSTYAEFKPC